MASGVFSIRQQAQAAGHGAWTGSQTTPYVEYLVVAGGGGGGRNAGGGGGAGGLLQGITPITARSSLTVTVGGGGTAGSSGSSVANLGTLGCNSVFGPITAIGGGGGGGAGGYAGAGNNGASGGGGASPCLSTVAIGGQGTFGQGNAGGTGGTTSLRGSGGGGGAGTIGLAGINQYGGKGGAGIASSISGSVVTYAGGGGGSASSCGGPGGAGGGGSGGYAGAGVPTAGSPNTGGGGGGDWNNVSSAGGGGSGIVIISYPDTYNAPTTLTGTYTASTSGSGSVSFNGTSNQSATYQTSSLGTANFTVECWFYNTDLVDEPIFSIGTYLNGIDVRIADSAANKLDCYFYNVGKSASFTSTNTWQHLAIVRNSGTTTVYLNGAVFITAFSDTNSYVGPTRVGSFQAGGATHTSFAGNISNFRLTNTAVYTTTFTPSTAPLTAISGTQLLLNTVSPSGFNDSSINAYTPTLVSTPTWNQLSPFATGLGYKNRVYTWAGSGTVTF
jgi:hypothetical protein